MKEKRNSSIELLRIIAMLMIVGHHLAMHSQFDFSAAPALNRFWVLFLREGGQAGVDIFFLISGYFLVFQKGWRVKSLLKLWLEMSAAVLIYSFIGLSTGQIELSLPGLLMIALKAMFPLGFNAWWFASVYMVLCLISPYINMILNRLSKKEYQVMLGIFLTIWSVMPTFLTFKYELSNVLWACTVYSIGGYIRLHIDKRSFPEPGRLLFFSTFSYFLNFGLVAVVSCLSKYFPYLESRVSAFYDMYSLFILLSSVLMFLFFLNWPMGYSRLVNTIAGTTFGIYLLHDNKIVRELLWGNPFWNNAVDSPWFILQSSAIILIIFIVGGIITFFLNLLLKPVQQYIIKRVFRGRDCLTAVHSIPSDESR